MLKPKKKLLVIFSVVFVLVLIFAADIYIGKSRQKQFREQNAALQCLDQGDHARCIEYDQNIEDMSLPVSSCYEFYKYRGNSIKDGISPEPYGPTTCEGFSDYDPIYFDINGNYVP